MAKAGYLCRLINRDIGVEFYFPASGFYGYRYLHAIAKHSGAGTRNNPVIKKYRLGLYYIIPQAFDIAYQDIITYLAVYYFRVVQPAVKRNALRYFCLLSEAAKRYPSAKETVAYPVMVKIL